MKRVLVTGATGFVGSELCRALAQSGLRVRAALRKDLALPAHIPEKAVVGDIAVVTDWSAALDSVDTVVHLAARAHVLNDPVANESLYRAMNALGTSRLAEAAARQGVRRFVYLSSIKVNGEGTSDRAFASMDQPAPQDAYGESKWLGEQHLLQASASSAMEAVIVRPPLIYGPGVRANFFRLMQWVDKERPLPFAAVDNRRSLVSIWNLCDLLVHVLEHPAAPGQIWMVSDGEDLSTPDLIRRIGAAMNRRARLLAVPKAALLLLGQLVGRGTEVRRLCNSLAVDVSQTRSVLGWKPPLRVDEAIERTVHWYLTEARSHGS